MSFHKKPPMHTLYLARKIRTIMKFCLIPHFFIGLYMYTNSSILTPWKFGSEVINKIIRHTNSRYFSAERFGNIHTLIFLGCVAFFIALFVLRYTLVALVRSFSDKCCKTVKDQLFMSKIQASDDFYGELNVMQLCREFNKTVTELKFFKDLVRCGNHRPTAKDEMEAYLNKLEIKLQELIKHFKVHFKRHNIIFDEANSKSAKKAAIRAINELLKQKKDEILKDRQNLSSPIYSYDIKDNDYYQGIITVEQTLRDQ